jgi:hypothetical protein
VALIAFDYRFTTRLPASADAAYRWATDYAPDDWARMGQVGRRRIEVVAPRTILLTDTIRRPDGTVTKKRLVRLRPRDRAWTNTHVGGPTRHSQFFYHITPRGPRASMLEFVGLQVERAPRPLSPARLARRAREVAAEDAALWRRLARVMASELGTGSRRRRGRRSR